MKFSLIIPVAPERNAEILRSIESLDYPKNKFEVIVINGKNPSENRNNGALKARGDYFVFLDDDALINPEYLKKVEEFINSHPEVDIVGGPQLTPKDERGFAKISGYALSSLFGAWKIANRYEGGKILLNADETMLTSANLICKKSVFEKIRFDINLFPGEDPKFISDAKRSGLIVAYSGNIFIYHRRRRDLKSLAKQIFNYGKTRPLKESVFETLKMPFFFIPSLFLIYLTIIIIFFIINIGLFWMYIPLIMYLILMIGFSIYDSAKNKDYKVVFVLAFIYPIIHLSYGIGMIYGYIKKITK